MNTPTETGYKYLFDSNPLPIIIFEIETQKILEVNSAALELYGYSYAEFLNMKMDALLWENPSGKINCFDRNGTPSGVYHKRKMAQ